MSPIPPAVRDHWFWAALTLAVLLWYSTVTVWVAIRGCADIRGMLRRLAERGREAPPPGDASPPGGPARG
jgi:hypothetical protein